MSESQTRPAGQTLQDRPVKRSRVDLPSTRNDSFDDAIERLVNDNQLPAHLKAVLGHLVERMSSMEVLIKKNHELEERLKDELAEKSKLKEEIEVLKCALSRSRISSPSQPRITTSSSPSLQKSFTPLDSSCCEEKERLSCEWEFFGLGELQSNLKKIRLDVV
ncbi:hypothetical protein Aduo_001800 [Ancylostoma duodenale]